MLLGFALIFLSGLFSGWLFKKLRLPPLLGMLIAGIIIGPHSLNLIDSGVLSLSADLKKTALIIILTRAGLSLSLDDLKKNGRPAFLLSFVPASFEVLGTVIFAPLLLGISPAEAALCGAVLGAVSPAVVVPKMLHLIDGGYGKDKAIPQMIMSGASVDDVFVIVLFSVFLSLVKTGSFSPLDFLKVPFSIAFGIAVGIFSGFLLSMFFQRFNIGDTQKLLIILSVSFLFTALEDTSLPFSAMIAVVSQGAALRCRLPETAEKLTEKYSCLWTAFEILLFFFVGASVNISYALASGLSAVLLLFCSLGTRMFGVLCCVAKTKLNKKERVFCMLSYIPKATVQAAIGSIPLASGLSCGESILTVAVLSIIITAPLGAFLIDVSYKKLLDKS